MSNEKTKCSLAYNRMDVVYGDVYYARAKNCGRKVVMWWPSRSKGKRWDTLVSHSACHVVIFPDICRYFEVVYQVDGCSSIYI